MSLRTFLALVSFFDGINIDFQTELLVNKRKSVICILVLKSNTGEKVLQAGPAIVSRENPANISIISRNTGH
ncbi:rCG55125 [Rattus norvegicus]|uniref:RCG55125 n=1 Tax=Rattus norvegicus TaxID=10116 RepID=A6III0_RAT|nr:rCG55125 [Rattus norvegicus]